MYTHIDQLIGQKTDTQIDTNANVVDSNIPVMTTPKHGGIAYLPLPAYIKKNF